MNRSLHTLSTSASQRQLNFIADLLATKTLNPAVGSYTDYLVKQYNRGWLSVSEASQLIEELKES